MTLVLSKLHLEVEFLDDRVDQHLTRHAFHLSPGSSFGRECRWIERQQEVFSLPHIRHAGITQTAERIGYSLTLGVEHGALQRDINMGFHQI
jgi:hypothetical protein